jgi:class 3 adenylate cyclase/predicted ATPase
MFCDLADSTRLSGQLDPEDLRDVIRAYQTTSAEVIERFDGYIAQHLGDGLLVYFGYPKAHEDDAQRAVRAGLGLLDAMGPLNIRLESDHSTRLAVRIGIHTGPVVVGEIGSGDRREHLALGDTPNLAARLQGLAAPDTVVMSAATARLVHGYFTCQDLGAQTLKGMDTPVRVAQVLGESPAQSRLDVAAASGFTPLVGRETEVTLLRERWAPARDGLGQVVLLSGEAGIGKSRLVQVLTEQVATESQAWLMPYQCSSYHQHSALYPLIELLERVALRFEREESPQQKLHKLEGFLVQYGLPLAEAVPLFAALLSLPLAAEYTPLHVPPAQQKQRTLQTLLTILLRIAAQQPVLFVMEDLHWVDPSTLEFLSLLVDQGPTVRILVLLTFRPDFRPPWTGRAHLTQVTVNRLPRHQAVEVIRQVAHGKDLPPEVMEQIVAKTDGVPLFVEELTKMVLESGLLQEGEDCYALTGPLPPLAIPTTLHDSLMARLDRLATVKGLAQLGATLGREFSYALLHAVSPWDEATVRLGLHQLVAAEFLYQQGQPPQATYRFKHALIQDAAYQSLLRSTRQRYHQHIAQVVEARFPEVCEIQPELLAHHYTEAGLREPAIPYWQHAGQRALQRSANLEAVSHATRGLEVLAALPETQERAQQELALHLTLGPALLSTRGSAAPEVECVYVRASELGRQVGDTPQLFTALWGLSYSHMSRAQIQTACAVGEELLSVARQLQDPVLLLEAHRTLVLPLTILGEFGLALTHAQHGLALYDPQQMRAHALRYGQDSGITCRLFGAWCLWLLGYPDQARQWSEAALTDAQRLLHAFTLAQALLFSVVVHHLRRETAVVQERAEVLRALCTEHNFAYYLAWGTVLQGSAWAAQGAWAEGLTQIHEGLAAWRTVGGRALWHWFRALLAEAYGRAGQVEEGQRALSEALETLQTTEDRLYEAEVYRLKGELLQQAAAQQAEAEEHLQQALAVGRRQQAKSLELRAATSLARLWQSQGKRQEAYDLLAPVYDWFTEGFDTADLQEAKRVLGDLS